MDSQWIVISGGSRISQTRALICDFVAKPIIWQDFCRKLHEYEKKLDREVPSAPALDPPMLIRSAIDQEWKRFISCSMVKEL